MNSPRTERPPTDPSTLQKSTFRTQWLNPRRKRFWAIIAVLLYTVLGFFLAPWLIKTNIINFVQNELNREASIEKVEINPFALSLTISGFDMKDTDGVRLVAFDQFHTNLQLSSVFRRAWTFHEISMTGPYFLFERYSREESRLSRLLADLPVSDEPEAATEKSEGLPRMLIQLLAIRQGSGDLRDNIPPTPVELALGPINVEINQLNTLPDQDGNQTVSIALPEGATLSWEGTLSLSPLDSSGQLVLAGSRFNQVIAYLEKAFPLDDINGILSARLDYRIQIDGQGDPMIELSNIQAEMDDLQITGLVPSEKFLDITKISVEGGNLHYPDQSIRFKRIQVDNPALMAWLDEQGVPSLNQLMPQAVSATEPPDINDEPSSPWSIAVDEIVLSGGRVNLADHRFEPAAAVSIDEMQFSLSQFTSEPGAAFPFSLSGGLDPSGEFAVEGNLVIAPELSLSANARATSIPLSLGKPYVAELAHLLIQNGEITTQADIAIEPGTELSVEGDLSIVSLELRDARDDSALLGWKKMEIDRFRLNQAEPGLHLSQLTLEEPFGRMVINQDLSTNLTGLMKTSSEPVAAPDPEAKSFNLVIGGTAIRDGNVDFADFSLPLPFATHISNLDGTISTITTDSTEPANIQLEGQVDEFGLARISGTMNLLDPIVHTDTKVEFRNLQMSNLTPYSVQFAGREIDEGKLDLDLAYVIKNGQLAGENEVVLSQLILGKEVDSPGAASLPLGLAVALLKDSEGVININLPVAGDINNPEFRIGGVIWQAFSGLITKIVTSPFRLLGNLIGIDSDDLGQFQFLAGRSDLTPPELEKVAQLEKALAERPELVIEIDGVIDPAIDTGALKFISLRRTVLQMLERDVSYNDDDFMMLDEEIRQVLESLFAERFPGIPLDPIRAEYTTQPEGDPEAQPEFDELAFAGNLRDRLLESEPVTEQDLQALGQARADTIKSAFLASGDFAEERVVIAGVVEIESEDGEWVVAELGVAAD